MHSIIIESTAFVERSPPAIQKALITDCDGMSADYRKALRYVTIVSVSHATKISA